SPVELTLAILERIDSLNAIVNCYITVLHDQAMAQAKALEALLMSGISLGPLHGVPVGVKDNVETADVRTTAASKVLAEWVPEFDATVVTRLKTAGAIVLGKLNMYEFAYGGWHPLYGDTHNPWD